MTVERTGTAVNINTSSNTGSQSITVPSDATLAVMFFGGASGDDTGFDSGNSTFSIGGFPATWRARSASSFDVGDCCVSTLSNPATGSQTFAWTCGASITYGNMLTIVFYKGVDTSSPVRSSGGNQATTLNTTLSVADLTYVSGDMMVGGVTGGNSGITLVGNSQSQIALTGPGAKNSFAYLGVADRASIGTFTVSNVDYPGIVALVLRQTSASAINQHSFRFFNDDGSESAATAKGNLNTNVTLSAEDVTRIRFLLDATSDPMGKQFQLEYRRKPSGGSFGDWIKVN